MLRIRTRPLAPLALAALAVLAVGCTPPAQRAMPNEVATQFLYFKKGETRAEASGGMGDLFVEVADNPGFRAPVRFAETTSGGVGDGWRAAVWMALLSATAVLDIDPAGIRVSVEADDAVDGPSAGAVTTVAIMAAHKGDKMLPNAAMTGAINPDLTIGPVGGVPEKVEAALSLGKMRIGIPAGQANARSLRTGKPVDLKALARKRGATLFELSDVTDAYEVMTGKRLPMPRALTPEQMELPEWVDDVFHREAGRVLDQVEEAAKSMEELFEKAAEIPQYRDLPRSRAELVAEIARIRAQIKKGGDSVGAIYAATGTQSWHFQITTALLMRMGQDLGKWQYVGRLLRNLRNTVAATLEQSVPKWQKWQASGALDVPFVIDTFEALIHAIRGLTTSQQILSRHTALRRLIQEPGFTPDNNRAVHREGLADYVANMINAQSNLLLGGAYFAVGEAWRARSPSTGSQPIPAEVIKHVSAQYQRVADANLQYVDALLLKDRKSLLSPDKARFELMEKDSDYRQAVMNRRLPELMSKKVLSAGERSYAVLSGAVSSYFASATVISKHYSLGAEFEPRTHRLVRLKRGEALDNMLELADRQARQVAAQCMDLFDEVPINALIEYDLGRRMEKAGRASPGKSSVEALNKRLEALGHLWRAYTLGRLAIATHRRIEATSTPY